MKGCLKNFLKFIALFLFFSFLESCDFSTLFKPDYNEGVKGYFEEYTETAAIMVQELDGKYPSDSQGITCFPSGDSRIVKLYLRNPQNYILNVSMESGDVVNNNVTVVQDGTDKSIVTVTYPGSWLLEKDKDDKDISGVIKIVEPVSGRSFEDWNIILHADSVPPAIKSPVFQLDSSDLDAAHYIVCFYFPNLSTIGNGVHSDVNVLLINGEKFYISGTSIYNDEGCTDLNESFGSEKPAGLTFDSVNNADFVFDSDSVPENYIAFYYDTKIKPSTDEVSYSFVLQDKAGLKSSEVSISNKAKKLSSPVICRTDGSELSSGESLAADEDTFLYTLLINHDGTDEDGASCGTAVINYTITETNGALVFADGTSSVLTAVSEGSVSVKLPKGTYTVTVEASKNFYLTSNEVSVSGIKIRKPAVYYISESGFDSDSQSGSAGEPYRTVQYALNQYAAGVTSGEYELDDGCDIRVLTDLTPPEDFDFSSNNNSFVNIGGTGFTATVNITGYGGVRTISAGQDQSDSTIRQKRVVYVAGGNVNIENINLANGYFQPETYSTVGYGGGLCVYGSGTSVTVKNSSIHSNYSSSGGGVYVSSNSTLYMENVSVYNNARYKYANGGGIYIGGTVTCVDCDIYENGWLNIPTGTVSGSDGGGGVLNGGTFSMTGGYIRNNMTYPTKGGGLSNKGNATLTGVTISGNRAPCSTSSVRAHGGGIYNTYTDAELTLKNCSVKENFAGGNGGGIYIDIRTSVSLEGTEISGNSAVDGGAGVYNYKSGSNMGSLKLKGKNTIYANTLADGTTASNLYMPTGSAITVDGDISGSKIGVNVPWESSDAGAPRIGAPAEFTSGYGTGNTVLPGEIFITENNYSITASSSGEAAFAVSGGGMYTALDYDVKMTAAASVKAALNKAKTVTVAVSGSRKEPGGTPTQLYYSNADGKFYTDPDLTAKAAGDNTVTFAAALYNGGTKVSDCEIGHPELDSGSILVTVPAIAFEDTYTIRVTSTFLGVTKDVSVGYKAVDMSGEIDAEDLTAENYDSVTEISVLSPAGINVIANLSATKTFEGKTIILDRDVELDSAFTPIGSGANGFKGTFDGKGETISGLNGQEALFSNVNGGTVKDLKVAGSTSVAGIAKEANSSAVIENCESSATVTSSTSEKYCAGIVAVVESATIKGCVNTGTITSNVALPADNFSYGAGGITGRVYNRGIVDSCKNTGNVTGPYAGGITGALESNSTIRNACNSGNVTSTVVHAGGITAVAVGSGAGVTNAAHIDNCFNSGSVIAEGTAYRVYVGGIAGKLGWGNGSWAQNCLNIGNVSISASAVTGSKAGALFGLKDSRSQIDFCYYKEGCAGSSFGTGGSSSDTANECIKATQAGTGDAVISADVTFFISVGGTIDSFGYTANWTTVCEPLNRWVYSNNSDNLYLEWETDSNHWPKLKAGQ